MVLESREYDHSHPFRRPHGAFYPQKLALTSPTSVGRSVGVVRSRTQATVFKISYTFISDNVESTG
jgi:hypothetical protein